MAQISNESYPDPEKYPEYVNFGDTVRARCGGQSQYISRYLTGWDGSPNLSDGIRWVGKDSEYHFILIHKDDVEEFVRRVLKYWKQY